jgi:hypothetical protein
VIERQPPTHTLTVEVPYVLHGGPFDALAVKDAITAVLAIARIAGHVCDNPQASIREVADDERRAEPDPSRTVEVPVVPCDEAALERAAEAVRDWTGGHYSTELAEAVLRAAGESGPDPSKCGLPRSAEPGRRSRPLIQTSAIQRDPSPTLTGPGHAPRPPWWP